MEIDAGREEAADLEVERVLPLAGNAVIVGEVVEARGPGYVAVDVEREVGLDLRTELGEDVLVLVFALGQRLYVVFLLEAVAGEVHVRVVVAAIHIIKREGGDVHVERNVAVHHLGDFLRELVLHTETAVEGHRGEEGGEEAVAVHVVVLDYLGAEADVEGIEPLLESLVAEEGAEADEVVVHLVGVDRVGLVREGVHVELQFQLVGYLYLVFVIVVLEELAVDDVEVRVSTAVPVRGDVVLRELDGILEARCPVSAFGDELGRGGLVAEVGLVDDREEVFPGDMFADDAGADGVVRQVIDRIAETLGVVLFHIVVGRAFAVAVAADRGEERRVRAVERLRLEARHERVGVEESQILRQIIAPEHDGHEEGIDDDGVAEGGEGVELVAAVVHFINPIQSLFGHLQLVALEEFLEGSGDFLGLRIGFVELLQCRAQVGEMLEVFLAERQERVRLLLLVDSLGNIVGDK